MPAIRWSVVFSTAHPPLGPAVPHYVKVVALAREERNADKLRRCYHELASCETLQGAQALGHRSPWWSSLWKGGGQMFECVEYLRRSILPHVRAFKSGLGFHVAFAPDDGASVVKDSSLSIPNINREYKFGRKC